MSQSLEHNSEESTEYESGDESSQGSLEYHSRQEPESERKQIILINRNEEFTFLNIWFPMPQQYPHLYIQLNKLMSHIDSTVPKSYPRIESIAGDPQRALGYIIHHFNIEKVSKSLCTFPNYTFDQVYYSTYIDTSRFNTLLRYYEATHKQLDKALKYQQKQIENALAKEQLEIQKTYGWYLIPDDLPITLLYCFL